MSKTIIGKSFSIHNVKAVIGTTGFSEAQKLEIAELAKDIAIVMAELGPALAGADWLSHVAATVLLGQTFIVDPRVKGVITVYSEQPIPVRDGKGVPARKGAAALSLEKVNFNYPGQSRRALSDVTFDIPAGKTVALVGTFATLGLTNALVIGGAEIDSNFKLAASNIPNIDVLPVQGINVYDILRRGKLVLSKAAVEALEERFK